MNHDQDFISVYADYDTDGSTRQITVSLPANSDMATLSDAVRMLFRAGARAMASVDRGLDDTRVIPLREQMFGTSTTSGPGTLTYNGA